MAAVLMRMSTPPNCLTVASSAALMVLRSRNVDGGPADGFLAGDGSSLFADALGALDVAVGDDDVGSALGCEQGDFAADAAASADDHHDAAAEFLLGWLAADLGLFELPVLDAEGLAGREGDVVVVDVEFAGQPAAGPACGNVLAVDSAAERAGALHDADGVGVELAGEA